MTDAPKDTNVYGRPVVGDRITLTIPATIGDLDGKRVYVLDNGVFVDPESLIGCKFRMEWKPRD